MPLRLCPIGEEIVMPCVQSEGIFVNLNIVNRFTVAKIVYGCFSVNGGNQFSEEGSILDFRFAFLHQNDLRCILGMMKIGHAIFRADLNIGRVAAYKREDNQ